MDTTPGDGHDDFSTTLNGSDYVDTFIYDLSGNRIKKMHDETVPSNDLSTTYNYNSNDQLTIEGIDIGVLDGIPDSLTSSHYYDANGSQTKVTTPSGTKLYLYDLRNRMIAADNNGDDLTFDTPTGSTSGTVNDTVDSTYGYDDDGVRVSETTGGASTYFLNDPDNPTGYSKTLEKRTGTLIANASLNTSYILGQRVEGQRDSTNGTLYLITDGHGSTRTLADSIGGVDNGDKFDYTAFGDPIGFTASSAKTNWLFGGDGVYDPASGLSFHGNGVRQRSGFRFIEADPPGYGSNEDPLSLHRYNYTPANPIGFRDFDGHMGLADQAFELADFYQSDRFDAFRNFSDAVSDPFGALSRSFNKSDAVLNIFDETGPIAQWGAWLRGFGEGAAQGTLNALNGVTDAFIGVLNLAMAASPATGLLNAFGVDLSISEWDWSNGLVYQESGSQHWWSKFLGGQGLITLATLGMASVGQAGEVHHVATVVNSKWTPLFETLFDDAGLEMEDAVNKVRVAGHFGPHPEIYHQTVYSRLLTAVAGKTGEAFADALYFEISQLAEECATPGMYLNHLITK